VTSVGNGAAAAGPPITSVGLIGTGNMGGRIGHYLVTHGRPVVGYHRDPAKVTRWGMEAAPGVAELVRGCDVLLLCLPDSPAVESVVHGMGEGRADGVLDHVRPGQIVVDLTTAMPASTRGIAVELAARGAAYVDAGVSGGARSAEKGALTVMLGGDADAVQRVRPLLEEFCERIHHMGPSGAGHTTKLLNNFLNAMTLSASAEVLVGARNAGLDLREFLAVVNHSSGRNYATETKYPHIVEGDYLKGGLTVDLMIKDIVSYLSMMGDLGGTAFTGAGVLAAFRTASAIGYGDVINNRVVDALGDLVGRVRLHDPEAAGDTPREGAPADEPPPSRPRSSSQ
jgi:3-hydroxyisobutyrate dehydrogenase